MLTFTAIYDWYKRGAYTTKHYVIVANTESEALGLALEAEPDTDAKDWTLTDITEDLRKPQAILISEHSN